MKPLRPRVDCWMLTRRLVGASGIVLIALGVQAGAMPLGENDKHGVKQSRVDDNLTHTGNAPLGLPAQSVTHIEVRPEEKQVTVAIVGDGKLFPSAWLLSDTRLVVDLPAVSSALGQSVINGHHGLLKKIRVGHHVDKARLVFDLTDRPVYSIKEEGDTILVTLKPDREGATPLALAQPASPAEVTSIDPDKLKVRFEPVTRVAKNAAKMISPAQSSFRVQPVQMVSDNVAPEKDTRADDVVVGQTRFVGRRISLDFQQADISNILRLIAEVSGFNIVVGESVKAKVTMKLVSVPWDQALDMLLKMNGLGMIRQGSIVWIDTLTSLARQQDDEARAKEAKVKAEELVDRVFYIRNIQAQELMTSLRQNLSPRGVMQFNAGSNALIVRDTETKLGVIRQLVEGLDLEVPQVQIEARIVQADTAYARGLGIQWGFQGTHQLNSEPGTVGNLTGPFSTSTAKSFLVNLPAQVGGLPAVPGIGWTFGKIGGDFALDMRLSAGELLGLTKVIAAPKITTLDKREAKISQGESVPYQTTSLQGTQTTFVDANLELNVTPQITSRDPKEEAKRILMRVRATRNAVGSRSTSAGPSIDRREANTQVLVRDGETMVIGGVFVDTQNNNVQGVPYMSRIPVLGWLFKNKAESVSKQELLIFLTPTIVKT